MSAKSTPKKSAPERDWARFDAQTDAEVEKAAGADPDSLPADADFWAGAEVVEPQPKQAISIRLDKDVLDYFRGQRERGYQTLINAVLRSYMDAHTKKRA